MNTRTRKRSADKTTRQGLHTLYYDIETISDPELSPELVESLLDRVKEEKRDETVSKFSVYALTNRIICIAYAIDDSPVKALYGKDEEKILSTFIKEVNTKSDELLHDFATSGRLIACTFNGQSFDQHILFVHLTKYGLELPRFPLRTSKYAVDHHIDLRSVLGNFENYAKGTLGQWAKFYQFPGDSLSGNGGEIARLFAEENWTEIKNKCKSDVELVRFIHKKIARYI